MIVALVLVSAFLHALWNALLRLERDKDRALVAAVIVAVVVAVVVAGVRAALGEALYPSATPAAWAAAAGVLEWAYFASLAKAMDRGRLGPVYTVSRGGAILAIWPASMALFGEVLTPTAAIGSGVVLAGLALTSAGAARRDDGVSRTAGLGWACTCAAAITGYHLAYKAALDAGGNPSAVFATSLALASAINVVRLGPRGRAALRAVVRVRGRRVLAMGLVCSASFLILLQALAVGGAGFVLTLRNTSVLFAAGLGAAIGEHPTRTQVAGAIAVAGGAVLMAWPA